MKRKNLSKSRATRCRFCTKRRLPAPGVFVDFKDVSNPQEDDHQPGELFSRNAAGCAPRSRREVGTAVKRARFMGLLPYVGE